MTSERYPDPVPLTINGWFLYDTCNCGGRLKHTYRNKSLYMVELKWYPRMDMFKIFKGGSTSVGLTTMDRLDVELAIIQEA